MMHYDDLAPVMPAIDVVQQLIEEEKRSMRESARNKGQHHADQSSSTQSSSNYAGGNSSGSSSLSTSNVIKPFIRKKTSSDKISTTTTISHLERSSSNSDTSKLEELNELQINNNVESSNTSSSDYPNQSTSSSFVKEDPPEEESYDKVLENYAGIKVKLGSTPDMSDTISARSSSNQANSHNAVTSIHLTNPVASPPRSRTDVDQSRANTKRCGIYTPRAIRKQTDYVIIPKSEILDVYSNDPEVENFLKQLPNIAIEHGYNEQDYKCKVCRRPIGMVFGQSRLCVYDGHLYCTECHLDERALIPARILCNWDFKKYPISKRNQHFLDLIKTEAIFDVKKMAPLLYTVCVEMQEMLNLRSQAFFLRSYCFTCTQDSISFELTKLVWPREHLIEHIHSYSLEDLEQVKSGALAQLLKNVVSFGRRHVRNCMLCCQKGFICEICKSQQIIYPFDTDSVYRCHKCQTVFHLECFAKFTGPECCPRCNRLQGQSKEISEKHQETSSGVY